MIFVQSIERIQVKLERVLKQELVEESEKKLLALWLVIMLVDGLDDRLVIMLVDGLDDRLGSLRFQKDKKTNKLTKQQSFSINKRKRERERTPT